jgi:hypothetical protein
MDIENKNNWAFLVPFDFAAMRTMPPEQQLRRMIDLGRYNSFSREITADKFPIECRGELEPVRFKLFDPLGTTIKDVAARMKSEEFNPAAHVYGLVHGAVFPYAQLEYTILCPGSSAMVRGSLCSLYFEGQYAGHPNEWRHLGTYPVGDDLDRFGGRWRILGVQKVSDT